MIINFKLLLVLIFLLFTLNLLFAENYMDIMAELTGEHSGSRFGFCSTSLDFNGDNIDDLVVTAERWDPEYPGWLYIF